MSTAIIHGDPGSFKSSAMISDYLVPALKEGRVVVTNIRGVKTVEEIADIYKCELPDTAQIILVQFNESGFEQMARFFHWAPEGALILMDEGQRIYPTRLKDFKPYDLLNPSDNKRPCTVEDAFDSHRHMNWDIYITTTNISKIHKEIRAVAEFGFRHKNMATVFSFMKGRYKRVTHNAENSGASMSHVISSSLKKIDKRCFDVYQSTATGTTKDSTASFSFFKQPKMLLLLCVIGYSVWNFGSALMANGGLPAMFGGNPKPPVGQAHTVASPSVSRPPAINARGDVPVRSRPENPFDGLTISIVGQTDENLLFQVIYPDNSYISINQKELRQLGFKVAKINSRIARLTFGEDSLYAFSKSTSRLPSQAFQPITKQLSNVN